VLSAFGVFFLAEGLAVEWPGGDVALLYVAAALVAVSQLHVMSLAREAVA
jgi:Ca2+/H+ antiporter, TMEM165/GDT1 family